MVIPVLVMLLALAVLGGRVSGAQGLVNDAATSAAQAAALAQDPADAQSDGQSTAQAALQQSGADCVPPAQVTVDLSDFAPGGTVTVSVTCDFSTGGLSPLSFGPSSVTGTATAPIEPYRSVESAT